MVIAAERARTVAMAAANAMVMAAATAVAAEMSTATVKATLKCGGRVAMLVNGGGGNGVFAVAMKSSGRSCPQLWRQVMAMAAMGKASEGARVRARMGHC